MSTIRFGLGGCSGVRRVPAPPSWRARVGGEELEEGDGVPSYGLRALILE